MEWLSSDLTVAQLRVLLVLQAIGSSRMSDIAATLEVALPTVTGIVDKLVRKDLVTRQADPNDRRLVIVGLSARGQELISSLWISGRIQIERLLQGLNHQQMDKVAEVAAMLLDNISGQNQQVRGGEA
jgi:DNA-binding MarR family transcriptional regulator